MRTIGRLSALAVSRTKKPGMYADGGGLWLQVTEGAPDEHGRRPINRSWIFRYMLHSRARAMGLGPLHTVSLADARERATHARRQRLDGIDPIEARKAAMTAARLDAAKSITFADCATRYIEAHKAGWRNEKHADQWTSTLDTYAAPIIGKLPVQSVDVGLVLKVLEPIWRTKPETASRVRGRIEAVLDWASARGYRAGENPARWRGHLEQLLPARAKVRKVQHHPALPYAELGSFMAALRAEEGVAARALDFTILTAARTSEVLNARWEEFDLDAKVWTVPGERMKAGRSHRVPLSSAAIATLEAMREIRERDHPCVFPGGKRGKPLSNMAMLKVLERMKRNDLTAHGFRSTFRDWAAERTNYPREVAEGALAHVVADKVEAAYRRGDLFDKRRRLMDEWAKFCALVPKAQGEVVTMRGRA